MPIDLSTLLLICGHCMLGKQTKTLVPKLREGVRAKNKLEKIFSDITGPEDVATKNGDKYMLNMIDDCTGYTWIYMLKQKSDACHDSFHLLSPNPLITILVASDVTSPTPLGLTNPTGSCHD